MKTLFNVLIITLCWVSMLLANAIRVPLDQPTVQAGINAAVKGDTVLVAAGTYYENINFKGKAITVASYFLMDGDTTHINNTIIDGSKPSHPDSGSVVFFISGEDTTSVLCGFTITKGSGTETTYMWEGTSYPCRAGGGIFCYNSGARITNNKISYNTTNSPDKDVFGGGLAALPFESTAYVILQDNQILHNTVTTNAEGAFGGGVELLCNGILINNLISYNSVIQNATDKQASSGGVDCWSLLSDRRKVIVESNKMSHNSVISYSNFEGATALAGGIAIMGSYGRFAKNEVSQNEIWVKSDKNGCGAGMLINQIPDSFIIDGNIILENAVKQGTGWGGGMNISENAFPTLTNNIIAGNEATNGGAFLIAINSTAKFINNTVINNKATTGGGIYLDGASSIYLMNTIMWGNQAATHAAIHIVSGSVQTAYCDIQGGWTGTGNIDADPLFMNTNCHLADASPCIDTGNPNAAYNDPEDATNPGFALFPARGKLRNDMGAFGGPGAKETFTAIKYDRPTNNDAQPNTFALFQNYPNPFNPSTTIEFALPKSAFVRLKVYNLLGEEVAKLVAEQRAAGIHKLNWDARGLASGVYLYRLEAVDYVAAKKLILMR